MVMSGNLVIDWTDQGYVPDVVTRVGLQRVLRARLSQLGAEQCDRASATTQRFIERMRSGAVDLTSARDDSQRDAMPALFYHHVLGRQRKFSACWWPDGIDTLDAAEEAALCEIGMRAGLADGQSILELGCGWGALTLRMAAQFRNSHIVAVTHARSQRDHIMAVAREQGLRNIEVVVKDINRCDIAAQFDRVVSVEMSQQVRHWPAWFRRVRAWLKPDGQFFMQVPAHRSMPYDYATWDEGGWLSRHFFSDAIMPSDDLALFFQDDLTIIERGRWDGLHYARTANAWLANLDAHETELWPVFERRYGVNDAPRWWMRWRILFMAYAEMFAYDHGQQWWVSDYLFERRR